MSEQQNFANHGKIVPAFHFFLMPVLFLNFASSVYLVHATARHAGAAFPLLHAILNLLLAVALIILAFLARIFALGVQDRVIRLEERLRYQQLLPDDLKSRINEFTINQVVALRFASDAELSGLARKVLDSNLNNRKAIKQMIQNWRADYQRI
jgi:cell division protein FtsL